MSRVEESPNLLARPRVTDVSGGFGQDVVDVGANIGHYSRKVSELVGSEGRVLAIEPVPATFSLLAHNARHFPYANLTLPNFAASDTFGQTGMCARIGVRVEVLLHGLGR